MRRDAAENRRRLIEAAAQVMRETGADVPLETISERAGVTRGTMYRNFQHRLELYAAVLERELAGIRETLLRMETCSLFDVMRLLIDNMDLYEKFQKSLPDLAEFDPVACRLDSIVALIEPHLTRAKRNGDVRADLSADDVLLAIRMIASGWRLDGAPDRDSALARRLRLIVDGLRPA